MSFYPHISIGIGANFPETSVTRPVCQEVRWTFVLPSFYLRVWEENLNLQMASQLCGPNPVPPGTLKPTSCRLLCDCVYGLEMVFIHITSPWHQKLRCSIKAVGLKVEILSSGIVEIAPSLTVIMLPLLDPCVTSHCWLAERTQNVVTLKRAAGSSWSVTTLRGVTTRKAKNTLLYFSDCSDS